MSRIQITGIKLGINFRIISSILSAVIFGLVASWELTLFLVLIFPVLVLVGVNQVRLLQGQMKKNKKRLERSSGVTMESIDNIRTVEGLGAEGMFFEKYRSLLAGPFK